MRLLLTGVSLVAVLATIVAGVALSAEWAIAVGAAGILSTVVAATYVVIKSIQNVLQRISGAQRQRERMIQTLSSLQQKIIQQEKATEQQSSKINFWLKDIGASQNVSPELEELRDVVEQILEKLDSYQRRHDKEFPEVLVRRLEESFDGDAEVEVRTATHKEQQG